MIPKCAFANLMEAIPNEEDREIGKKHLPGMICNLTEAMGGSLYVDGLFDSIVEAQKATCALFLAVRGLIKTTPYVETHGAIWWVFEGAVLSMPATSTGLDILNISKVEDADVPEEVIAALNP